MPINIVLKKIKVLLVILLCMGVSGCATTSMRSGDMGGNVSHETLDDEQLLTLFHRIYNEPVQTPGDEIAKDITITAFMIALKSRRSEVIKDSGVLEKPYRKIELDKWTDDDLLLFYNTLWEECEKKDADNKNVEEVRGVDGRIYWAFKKTSETEKNEETSLAADNETALEIIHLTALYAVDGERSRRDTVKGMWHTVGSTVIQGIGTAARVAVMLAGFFFI